MKLLNSFVVTAMLAMVAQAAQAQQMATGLLGIEGEEATSVAVYVKDLRTGEVLVDHNSRTALLPASVNKSVTCATALSLLGDEYRFETTVSLRGKRSGKSIWAGDLVVTSCGDPSLESENFEQNLGFCDSIAAHLHAMGIKRIDGKIVVEQSMSGAGPLVSWEIDDAAWAYGAGVFGLNWRDNIFKLYPATGTTEPHVPGISVNLHQSDDGNDIVRGINSSHFEIWGRDITNKEWALYTTMPDPAAVMTYELAETLKAKGISVSGRDVDVDKAKNCENVYTHLSPTSGEIMKSLMERSDNMFAECMLRAIAPAMDRHGAVELEKELWMARGIEAADRTIIVDGSGLARGNRLSPAFLASMYEWMWRSPLGKTYVGFFPVSGVSGTMRSFGKDTPLKGRLAFKTGSVNAVQTYGGYVLGDDGNPTHVAVIMVNSFFCPRVKVRQAAEQLMMRVLGL